MPTTQLNSMFIQAEDASQAAVNTEYVQDIEYETFQDLFEKIFGAMRLPGCRSALDEAAALREIFIIVVQKEALIGSSAKGGRASQITLGSRLDQLLSHDHVLINSPENLAYYRRKKFIADSVFFLVDKASYEKIMTEKINRFKHDYFATVHLQEHNKVYRKSNRKLPQNDLQFTDDLSNLVDISRDAVVKEVERRFLKSQIYTCIHNSLISVNPYQYYSIYNPRYQQIYHNHKPGSMSPHIFGVADIVHQRLMQHQHSQAIIIMGEPGSGKTKCVGYLLQQLVHFNKKFCHSSNILKVLHHANCVLDTFCSANTGEAAPNSSRSCTVTDLQYNEMGMIVGASINVHLLELSRLMDINRSKSNFHIFNHIAGDGQDYCEQFGLQHFKANCNQVNVEFSRLTEAFEGIGIDKVELDSILKLLAGLMHLSNVEFSDGNKQHSDVSAKVSSSGQVNYHLQQICRLFDIKDVNELKKKLTITEYKLQNETMRIPLLNTNAVSKKFGIIKSVYSDIVKYLTKRINQQLFHSYSERHVPYYTPSITRAHTQSICHFLSVQNKSHGINSSNNLDNYSDGAISEGVFETGKEGGGSKVDFDCEHESYIFSNEKCIQDYKGVDLYMNKHKVHNVGGTDLKISLFEIFDPENIQGVNNFEQFCTNHANEVLHTCINKVSVHKEKARLMNEGLMWEFLCYTDNSSCVDLFSRPPTSLMSLINEATILNSNTTDHQTTLYKIRQNFSEHPNVILSRAAPDSMDFSIVHYFGIVKYDLQNLIHKNSNSDCAGLARRVFFDGKTLDSYMLSSYINEKYRCYIESCYNKNDRRSLKMLFKANVLAVQFMLMFKNYLKNKRREKSLFRMEQIGSERNSSSVESLHSRRKTKPARSSLISSYRSFTQLSDIQNVNHSFNKNNHNHHHHNHNHHNSSKLEKNFKRCVAKNEKLTLFEQLNNFIIKKVDRKDRSESYLVNRKKIKSHQSSAAKRWNTELSSFASSLNELVCSLAEKEIYTVMCLKANNNKMAGQFDRQLVFEQLYKMGCFTQLNWSRLVYFFKIEYCQFVVKFNPILSFYDSELFKELRGNISNISNMNEQDNTAQYKRDTILKLMAHSIPDIYDHAGQMDIQFGTTTVFIRRALFNTVKSVNHKCLIKKLKTIQEFAKSILSYKRFNQEMRVNVERIKQFFTIIKQWKNENHHIFEQSSNTNYSVENRIIEDGIAMFLKQKTFLFHKNIYSDNNITSPKNSQPMVSDYSTLECNFDDTVTSPGGIKSSSSIFENKLASVSHSTSIPTRNNSKNTESTTVNNLNKDEMDIEPLPSTMTTNTNTTTNTNMTNNTTTADRKSLKSRNSVEKIADANNNNNNKATNVNNKNRTRRITGNSVSSTITGRRSYSSSFIQKEKPFDLNNKKKDEDKQQSTPKSTCESTSKTNKPSVSTTTTKNNEYPSIFGSEDECKPTSTSNTIDGRHKHSTNMTNMTNTNNHSDKRSIKKMFRKSKNNNTGYYTLRPKKGVSIQEVEYQQQINLSNQSKASATAVTSNSTTHEDDLLKSINNNTIYHQGPNNRAGAACKQLNNNNGLNCDYGSVLKSKGVSLTGANNLSSSASCVNNSELMMTKTSRSKTRTVANNNNNVSAPPLSMNAQQHEVKKKKTNYFTLGLPRKDRNGSERKVADDKPLNKRTFYMFLRYMQDYAAISSLDADELLKIFFVGLQRFAAEQNARFIAMLKYHEKVCISERLLVEYFCSALKIVIKETDSKFPLLVGRNAFEGLLKRFRNYGKMELQRYREDYNRVKKILQVGMFHKNTTITSNPSATNNEAVNTDICVGGSGVKNSKGSTTTNGQYVNTIINRVEANFLDNNEDSKEGAYCLVIGGHKFEMETVNAVEILCECCSQVIDNEYYICRDCNFVAHEDCIKKNRKTMFRCTGLLKLGSNETGKFFGIDLLLLVTQGDPIPILLSNLLREIEERGLDTEGIYRKPGHHDLIQQYKEKLDCPKKVKKVVFSEIPIHTCCSLVKMFFRELPIPLVPTAFMQDITRITDLIEHINRTNNNISKAPKENTKECFDLIEQSNMLILKLPPFNKCLFERMMLHFSRIVIRQVSNKMNHNNLAIVFAPTFFMQPEFLDVSSLSNIRRQTLFIENMILHSSKTFESSIDAVIEMAVQA